MSIPGFAPLAPLDPVRGPGSPLDRDIVPGFLTERLRFDTGHAGFESDHVNFEIFANVNGKNHAVVNEHIDV